jgi:hypothetical protein
LPDDVCDQNGQRFGKSERVKPLLRRLKEGRQRFRQLFLRRKARPLEGHNPEIEKDERRAQQEIE